MRSELQPIFIFSLPRAGSTLLQRMLASHPDISTASEPWLLLPLFFATRQEGVFTEYGHRTAVRGIHDFVTTLPNGTEDYDQELKHFATRLYHKASQKGAKYFLDKTPRYHLICESIINTFQSDAKYIFLWRNPISVATSMLTTWHSDHWSLYKHRIDLFNGVDSLVRTFENHASVAISLRYEDLVRDPKTEITRIAKYLDIPYDRRMVESFSEVRLSGRMGDPTGTAQFRTVNALTVDKWKNASMNSVRKRWYRSYVRWIGSARLSTMGLSFDSLMVELNDVPETRKGVVEDALREAWGYFYLAAEPSVTKYKFRALRDRKVLVSHS